MKVQALILAVMPFQGLRIVNRDSLPKYFCLYMIDRIWFLVFQQTFEYKLKS